MNQSQRVLYVDYFIPDRAANIFIAIYIYILYIIYIIIYIYII